jgi:hypothetical protein
MLLVEYFDTDFAFYNNVELITFITLLKYRVSLFPEFVRQRFSDVHIMLIGDVPFLEELNLLNNRDQTFKFLMTPLQCRLD